MNKVIFILSTLLCFWSTPTVFANSNGEIFFQGAVIEAPNCQAIQINKKIQLDCSLYNDALSESDIVFHSQVEYLDQVENLAVMQITYN